MPLYQRSLNILSNSITNSTKYYLRGVFLEKHNITIRKYGPYTNIMPYNWNLEHTIPIPNEKLTKFIDNLSYKHFNDRCLPHIWWKYIKTILKLDKKRINV